MYKRQGVGESGGGGDTKRVGEDQPPPRATRYWGTKTLDADFPARDFSTIQQEILHYLSVAPGTTVEVRIEIAATTTEGFDDSTQRTVRENANTVGFEESNFEVE